MYVYDKHYIAYKYINTLYKRGCMKQFMKSPVEKRKPSQSPERAVSEDPST
jgi:hypothetical protein